MTDLTIYIPTYRRWERKLRTLDFIPEDVPCYLVVSGPTEFQQYKKVWPYVIDSEEHGISNVRKFILLNSHTRYAMMLDDDLTFFYRTPDLKLHIMDHEDFTVMLHEIRQDLEYHAHVGISHRMMNQAHKGDFEFNCRMMNAYAYDTRLLRAVGIEFGRVKVMEDFDLTLQLIERGFSNKVYFKYAWNQDGSNASGGCSKYRTADVQREAALKLKELHPDFVKVVTRDSKWKGMTERTDVRIAWAKAARMGRIK